MRLVIEALKSACDKEKIYLQIGVTVFKVWVVILAFVGIQLAWNLRPFLGDRGEEFKLLRKYEGNFYTAVIYSVQQLVGKNEKQQQELEVSSKTELKDPIRADSVEYFKYEE